MSRRSQDWHISGWLAAALVPLVLPITLLAKLLSTKKTRDRSAAEVAGFLRDFIDGSGGEWDWDDFTSVPITNQRLDNIRIEAGRIPLADNRGIGRVCPSKRIVGLVVIHAVRGIGIWMGGVVPLGYQVKDRKLIVNEAEAMIVRLIFERFVSTGSATVLARALDAEGVRTRRGKLVDKGFIYKVLNNRVYVGDSVHKGTAYRGEHEAIVSHELWGQVRSIMQQSPRARAANTRARTPALLKGLIFGSDGRAMTPTHTRRRGRLYRYYAAAGMLKGDVPADVVRRVPAAEVEAAVIDQLRRVLCTPEIIVATWRSAKLQIGGLTEADVRDALSDLDPLWTSYSQRSKHALFSCWSSVSK